MYRKRPRPGNDEFNASDKDFRLALRIGGWVETFHALASLFLRWPGRYWVSLSLTQCSVAVLAIIVAIQAAAMVGMMISVFGFGTTLIALGLIPLGDENRR